MLRNQLACSAPATRTRGSHVILEKFTPVGNDSIAGIIVIKAIIRMGMHAKIIDN